MAKEDSLPHILPCTRPSRRDLLASVGIAAVTIGLGPLRADAAVVGPAAAEAKPARLRPFDMADVTLAEGPFLHAPRMTEAYPIGRAHVCTPVTNAHLVCRLLLETTNAVD